MNDKPTNAAMKTRSAELAALEAMRDEDIDYSDIPPTTDWTGAVRGKFYRPNKQVVTIRLDADLVSWLKAREPRYQTAVNRILRDYMMSHRKSA